MFHQVWDTAFPNWTSRAVGKFNHLGISELSIAARKHQVSVNRSPAFCCEQATFLTARLSILMTDIQVKLEPKYKAQAWVFSFIFHRSIFSIGIHACK
jgi:hypothetical protein